MQRGKIVLTPKLVIDRSKFPNADDEYTPARRRTLTHAWPGLTKTSKQVDYTDRLTLTKR